jgi:hypothetical protein
MIDWSTHALPFWSFKVKCGTCSPICGPSFDTSIRSGDWQSQQLALTGTANSATTTDGA